MTATRFYLPSAGTPAVVPAAVGTLWDAVGAKQVRPMSRTKTGTTYGWSSSTRAASTPDDVLCYQFVSEPIPAQTVQGNWSCVIIGYEANLAANASLQMVVRVVSNDGSVSRGTVYAGHAVANNATVGALGEEYTTANRSRIIPGVAGSSVVALANDRIVVELGYRTDRTDGAAYAAEVGVRDDQTTDYALTSGITSTAFNTWVETSQDIFNPPVVNAPPTANAGADFTADPNAATTFTLTGSGSADSDGTIASYVWEDVTGSPVTIAGAGSNRTVTTPLSKYPQTRTYRLTVTDNEGATNSDTVVVSVLAKTGITATRFYLPSAGASPSPADGITTGWDGAVTEVNRLRPLRRVKSNTALVYNQGFRGAVGPTGSLLWQWVSEPLAAQTVSGNWSAVIQLSETDAAFDASLQMRIRVIAGDGTSSRGTVYSGHTAPSNATNGALGQEAPVTTSATRIIPGVAGTPVAAFAGDRLVIELGYRADNPSGGTFGGDLAARDDAVSDYPLTAGITSAAFNPWVETDQALVFYGEDVIAPATWLTLVAKAGVSTATVVTPPALPDILGRNYWKGQFDAVEPAFWSYNLPLSQSLDSLDHYNGAYGVDGYTSMFEATGSTAYLDKALTLISNLMASAQESNTLGPNSWNQAGVYGWVSQRADVLGQEVPLFESFMWRYCTRTLTAMRANPTVIANSTYKTKYDAILAFIETNIFDKWVNRDLNGRVYRVNTNLAAHWAYISGHLRNLTLSPARQAKCDTIRAAIDHVGIPNRSMDSLRKRIRASLDSQVVGAYTWKAYWDDHDPLDNYWQDVGHANAEISWICESLDYYSAWDKSLDVPRFIKALERVVWKNYPTRPQTFAFDLSGAGTGDGWLVDGWCKLGRHSVAAQQFLEDWEGPNTAQLRAAMAVNALRHGVI